MPRIEGLPAADASEQVQKIYAGVERV